MKIRILDSASLDLVDGYRFYEMQAEGVGAYFLDSLYSDIDSLIISAGMHSVHFGKYHRLLSKRFPFAVPRLPSAPGVDQEEAELGKNGSEVVGHVVQDKGK